MYIIITIVFLGTLTFVFFWQKERDKTEQKRFREFVIACKTKNIDEYATALPSIEDDEFPEEEVFQDLSDLEPEKLKDLIENEYESK
jgi:hypothetical protein